MINLLNEDLENVQAEIRAVKKQLRELYPHMSNFEFDQIVNNFVYEKIGINIKLPSDPIMQPSTYSKPTHLPKDFIVFDLETTGFQARRDQIIQIGAIRYVNFVPTVQFNTLINPMRPIPERITQLTSIQNEDVWDMPTIDSVLPEFLTFVGDATLLAHNASFDMKFLIEKMDQCQLAPQQFHVIDTMALAKKYIKNVPNYKLPTFKQFFNMQHVASHEALADCEVTGKLYEYCYREALLRQQT